MFFWALNLSFLWKKKLKPSRSFWLWCCGKRRDASLKTMYGSLFYFFLVLGINLEFCLFGNFKGVVSITMTLPTEKNGWYVTLHTDPKDTLCWYFFGGRSEKLEKGKIKSQNNKQSRRKLKNEAQRTMKKAWKSQFFFEKIWTKWNFSNIFKLNYFHQFLSNSNGSKCKIYLNSSNFSNLKWRARAKAFARQKTPWNKSRALISYFLMHYFQKYHFL